MRQADCQDPANSQARVWLNRPRAKSSLNAERAEIAENPRRRL